MRARLVRLSVFCSGMVMLAWSIGARLAANGATPVEAPEIDGGSLSAGLGLLAASILILRSRRRSQ